MNASWSMFVIDRSLAGFRTRMRSESQTPVDDPLSRLIQCLLSKNIKTHVSTGHVTHVYALLLSLVLVLPNQRPGWSPRTGAHLHQLEPVKRAKPRSFVPRQSASGHRRQHEPEVHGDRRWHPGRSEPAVRGRRGDAERVRRHGSGGMRARWERFLTFWHLWRINSSNCWECETEILIFNTPPSDITVKWD